MPKGAEASLLQRHNEIRSALHFFLSSWYSAKQAGTSIDKSRVLQGFIKYRSLDAVVERLTLKSHPQSTQGGSREKR